MQSFSEYLNEVNRKYEKESSLYPSVWTISNKIEKKIAPDGAFLPFYGFTTVFKLKEYDWSKCNTLAELVKKDIVDLLTILPASTYHITLHTLWNNNNTEGGREAIAKKMAEDLPKLKKAFRLIMKKYGNTSIRMKALGVSSDCSDVVSIKFVPATEKDYNTLNELFGYIEGICPLGKPYLPHISLGYFKAKQYSMNELERLFSSIKKYSSGHSFFVDMAISDLVYETHEDMSGYKVIEI